MELLYSRAEYTPLGVQREPSIGVPRVFIVHTMVGTLNGTEAMFKRNGYVGTESTFGIGGPADGVMLDGHVVQWQTLDHQADAQFDGNAYATSVETSDGGDPSRPWSAKQLQALIDLGTWWARQTKHPARIVDSINDAGFGYHRQFAQWNKNAHECPGDVRLAQYRDIVVPRIAANLVVRPTITRLLKVAKPLMRGNDVKVVQRAVGLAAHDVDGLYGVVTASAVKRWQHAHGIDADGIWGPESTRVAGWTWRG